MARFRIGGKYEYCPNGSYWEDISGIFDTSLYLFCDCKKCNGSVYELRPINVTKKIRPETITRVRKEKKIEDLRQKITEKNYQKVKDLIDVTNKYE